MTNLQEEIEKGRQARLLLENPALKDVLALLEADIFRKWCNTQDAEKRQELWLEQKVAKAMLTRLHNLVEDGKIAEKQLN